MADKAYFLDDPIMDECLCGRKVKPTEGPQRLVFDDETQVFFRMCKKCLDNERKDSTWTLKR